MPLARGVILQTFATLEVCHWIVNSMFQIHHSPRTDASRVQCIRKLVTAGGDNHGERIRRNIYVQGQCFKLLCRCKFNQIRRLQQPGLTHLGAQSIASRDRRRPTSITIFMINISCLFSCLLYSWHIGCCNILEVLAIVMDARQQITYLKFRSNKWLSLIGCY